MPPRAETDPAAGVPVTAVVPAWNLDAELRECLASIERQTAHPATIVVDNASDSPLPSTPAVRCIRLDRRVSVGAARNAGLAAVDTPYVLFMEGDDVLLPHAVEYLFDALERDSGAVAVAASVCAWNPVEQRQEPARWPFAYMYRLSLHPLLFAMWNCVRNVFPTVGPVLIRTDAARRAGGFGDANWAEDWALGAVLCFQGRVLMRDRPCGLYRVNVNRVTLSDLKERRLRPSWAGRRLVRRKLHKSDAVPRLVRLLAPALFVPHAFFALQDVAVARQRV